MPASAHGPAGRAGLLSTTVAPAEDVPAWAHRNLGRLGYEELLSSTAEAARAAVAADVAYLLDAGEDGELRVRAVAGAESARPEPGAVPGGAVRVLAGAAMSLVTVPLVVDGRVTGVLAVAAAAPDRFGEQDAARLQDLADWSAPPLERARQGELEHGRRERSDFLAAASEELSVSLDEARIAAAGTSLVIGHLASWCAVLAANEGGPSRLLHAAHCDAAAQPALEWLLERVDPPAGLAPDRPFRSRAAGWRWQPEVPAGDRRRPQQARYRMRSGGTRISPGWPAARIPQRASRPAAAWVPQRADRLERPSWRPIRPGASRWMPPTRISGFWSSAVQAGTGRPGKPGNSPRAWPAGSPSPWTTPVVTYRRRVSAAGQPPPLQNPARQESGRQEPARQEPVRHEPGRQDPVREDSPRQDSPQDAQRREPVRQDSPVGRRSARRPPASRPSAISASLALLGAAQLRPERLAAERPLDELDGTRGGHQPAALAPVGSQHRIQAGGRQVAA